jgi:putative hydrolase of the HAD superfamily
MAVLPVPWRELELVFLDAGNTLVSIDFDWVADELARLGVTCAPEALRRAEAAARPAISAAAAARGRTEGGDAFRFYLESVLARLDAAAPLGAPERRAIVERLAPVLRAGGSERLWSAPMPRIREALAALRELGLSLVVVSNSDGSVERLLGTVGLRPYLDAVIDSHVVGFEKPDPRIFHAALAGARAHPERALHVGDLYAADVVGARAAGIHALLLDPYGDWEGVDCERSRDVYELAERVASERSERAASRGRA